MDIEGLGEETVSLLYREGLIRNVSDLYDLHGVMLSVLPRLGDKSAENIVSSIRKSSEVPFHRVLYALGIRFVGETTAKNLASHFRTIDALMGASIGELTEAEEVGEKIAESIRDYFADEENRRIIDRLRGAGLQFEMQERELRSEQLAGKKIVISGTFRTHSRDEMKELIELHGGKNLAAVSSQADFLLAGDKIGPAKLVKVKKLGIPILSEEEFLRMIDLKDGESGFDKNSTTREKYDNNSREPELF